jgi:hypothetical protein
VVGVSFISIIDHYHNLSVLNCKDDLRKADTCGTPERDGAPLCAAPAAAGSQG